MIRVPIPEIRVLIPEAAIQQRVRDLAAEINHTVAGSVDVLILLKGAWIFGADLARSLARVNAVHFAKAKSYLGSATTPEKICWNWPEELTPQGKTLLILDDILDSGATIKEAKLLAQKAGYQQVHSVVLMRKVRADLPLGESDFVGFDIPDLFVLGYGLDHDERYRTLPFIGVLTETLGAT